MACEVQVILYPLLCWLLLLLLLPWLQLLIFVVFLGLCRFAFQTGTDQGKSRKWTRKARGENGCWGRRNRWEGRGMLCPQIQSTQLENGSLASDGYIIISKTRLRGRFFYKFCHVILYIVFKCQDVCLFEDLREFGLKKKKNPESLLHVKLQMN